VQFVLDSFALVVFFLRQKGWEIVSRHLNDAADGRYSHLISSINYGEVYYSIIREEGEVYADAALKAIAEMPIEIVDPTRDQVLAASRLKSEGKISYADCFAAALALERGLYVLRQATQNSEGPSNTAFRSNGYRKIGE